MPGLEFEGPTEVPHLCHFTPTVIFKDDEEVYSSFKLMKDNLEKGTNKPADTIKLQSKCGTGAQCVFKVTETDVNNWTGLDLRGTDYFIS